MTDIIAICSQKGGSGKTTTALALVAAAFRRGKRALLVDLDAQGDSTVTMAGGDASVGVYDVLTNGARAQDVVVHTLCGDLLPGTEQLACAMGGDVRLLKAKLDELKSYDVVVLDCPPHLGFLTLSALTVATRVVVPAEADLFGLRGIIQLADQIQAIKARTNPNLKISGILLTRYMSNKVISRDLSERIVKLAEKIGTQVFSSKIRECTALREAQLSGQNIFSYSPTSNAAVDYTRFYQELMEGTNRG